MAFVEDCRGARKGGSYSAKGRVSAFYDTPFYKPLSLPKLLQGCLLRTLPKTTSFKEPSKKPPKLSGRHRGIASLVFSHRGSASQRISAARTRIARIFASHCIAIPCLAHTAAHIASLPASRDMGHSAPKKGVVALHDPLGVHPKLEESTSGQGETTFKMANSRELLERCLAVGPPGLHL